MSPRDGAAGWDDYAPFYDWENARTLGRRDVGFWRRTLAGQGGRVLELGCGTGRLLTPLARAGVAIVGIDRSAPMLARATGRARRLPRARRPAIVRGDIRALPFGNRTFHAVMAPYGLLQSLLGEADLAATLADAARVLRRGGLLGIDLVPDLPAWAEYRNRISLRGRGRDGRRITLVESVRQDRRRRLTIFDEEFVERRGRHETRHRFSLTFRTLALADVLARVERAGFRIDAVLGDYAGRPWSEQADVWLVRARRR